ncbi:transcription initiation factor TFIID subunit 11-like [Helianthus annuus]|uniref:transcription initiation factor TFIID subunit 11-like n=1 Tax=Helianthus annuus TaxID=4232 RepID=UPI000B8EF5BC|nr:transcription initiation factor TFIID subunit 11-like [Helianthus annuus]
MPPQNPGDSWRFNYDTLWDLFDMEEETEEEMDFFDELDILREYESSGESMLAEIPRPDGSKKVDVTLNAIADEKARLKKDMEAKGKSRFEQEKKVYMEMEVQGISEPKDEESPKTKRKQSTRKVRQPKSIPSRLTKHTPQTPKSSSHQTSKPTDVKSLVVSTAVGTSVVSTDVTPTTTTTTTSTYTQSTVLPKTTTTTTTSNTTCHSAEDNS